jgi:hypothetical protein
MNASQKRAVASHRRRLGERGLARYEVRGLEQDKQLIREIAKRLTANDTAAEQLRAELKCQTGKQDPSATDNNWPRTGKDLWDALRRSPLVGANLDLEREVVPIRDLDL